MKIIIKATNIKLSPALNDYVEQKMSGCQKFLGSLNSDAVEARVEVGKPSAHHHKGDVYSAEVNLRLGGQILRAQTEDWDARVAIDGIKNELCRKIKEYKNKRQTKNRRGARSLKKAKSISDFARFRPPKKHLSKS